MRNVAFIAVTCLLLPLFGVAANEPAVNPPLDSWLLGTWSGQASHNGQTTPLTLKLRLDDQGALNAYLDLPALGLREGHFGKVSSAGRRIRFGPFEVVVSEDGKGLHGVLPEAMIPVHKIPFSLSRVDAVTPVVPAVSPGPTASPLWTFHTGGPIWSSPAVSDGRVYFGSNDAKLYALDSRTGELLWSFRSGGPVVARPLAQRAAVFIPSDDGFLYKLHTSSGEEHWRFALGKKERRFPTQDDADYDYLASGATWADGVVYVGSPDGHLYAVDDETGKEKWRFLTGERVRSTPAVAGGLILFASRDHHVYAVEASTGSLRWQKDTGHVVVSSPAVFGDTVIIGNRSYDIFGLDLDTGAEKWRYYLWFSWIESSAAVLDGVAYVGSSDAELLLALDAITGKEQWSYDTGGSAWSSPAVTGQTVFVGAVGTNGYFLDHQGGFRAVDRRTGREQWRYDLEKDPNTFLSGVASSPFVADGIVYFGALSGTFYAFSAH